MRTLLAALAVAIAGAPLAARAQDAYLGLRIGLGLPFGNIAAQDAIRDVQQSHVPVQIDGGYIFDEHWSAGAYLSYAWGQLADEIDTACGAADCSTATFRFGIQGAGRFEIRPEREVWAGLLFGWERLDLDAPGALEATASGWEFGVQGGFDFASTSAGFGPYLSLAWGRFGDLERGGNDVSLPDKEIHTTLTLGIRGYFKL
jgi:hypothetical protein